MIAAVLSGLGALRGLYDTPLGRKALGIALVLAVFCGYTYAVLRKGENRGAEKLSAKIERNNSRVEKKVLRRLRTVDDCHAAGRVWRRETGTCGERKSRVPHIPGPPRGRPRDL
jgi:hypothetical protein